MSRHARSSGFPVSGSGSGGTPVLLCPVGPGASADPRTEPTRRARAALAPRWTAAGGLVWVVPCGDDGRYEAAVRAAWDDPAVGDLVIWEHDIEATPEALAGLQTCPLPLCAVAYPLFHPRRQTQAWATAWTLIRESIYDPTDRRVAQVIRTARMMADLLAPALAEPPGGPPWVSWAHRVVRPDGSQRWIRDGETGADLVGFGLVRFRQRLRARWPAAWDPGPWHNLDSRVSDWLYRHGIRAHIHWPAVPHHHGDACHPYGAGEDDET